MKESQYGFKEFAGSCDSIQPDFNKLLIKGRDTRSMVQ